MAFSAPTTGAQSFTPMSMNGLAASMMEYYIEEFVDPPLKNKDEDEDEDDEDDEDEGENNLRSLQFILQFRHYMENISTDARAIGAEKGRQLYQAMQVVGLEDTAWAIHYISTAMYMVCLGSAKGERERGNQRFGSEDHVKLWFEGMLGCLEDKQMQEEPGLQWGI